MAAEKKARMELEEARNQLRRMQELDRKDKRKMADEEALRKIKKLEETITDLQKSLAAQKQVHCVHRLLSSNALIGPPSLNIGKYVKDISAFIFCLYLLLVVVFC